MPREDNLGRLIGGRPARLADEPLTAKVVRIDGGVFAVALDDDTRHPIGPCRGPEVAVDDIVLLIWTSNDQPWIAQVDVQGGDT